MRALTVIPTVPRSVRLDDVAEPLPEEGSVLIDIVAVGLCGTDRDILRGEYGTAPPGADRLIIGHEAVGRVRETPSDGALAAGDLVVPIVRRPDPVPCANCAAGEWDMCSNGRYTEHGIKGLPGFLAARARLPAEFLVRVDPALGEAAVLLEPASIVAKAWDHVERIGRRAVWQPRRVLITGAGPIGLLAALMGVQRKLSVTILDHNATGPKPALARALGADVRYVRDGARDAAAQADVVIECTGAPDVVLDVIAAAPRNAIVCLTGLSSAGRGVRVDMGVVNRSLVLENNVVFGSVNANRSHYERAAVALAAADRAWLRRMITRRLPLTAWADAIARREDDVKVVIEPSLDQPTSPAI